MQTILNETTYAEKILKNGDIGKKPSSTLFLLAKYFRHKKGFDAQQTETALDSFMEKNYPGYTAVLWEQTIHRLTKKSGDSHLREIDFIAITAQELECIRLLKNPKYERLVFVLLCHAKLYDAVSGTNNAWANVRIPDLFRLARVSVRHRDDKFLYLNDIETNPVLGEEALISFSHKNDNLNIRVNFISTKDTPVLKISDLREPGYEYMNFRKEGNFIRCSKCRRLVRIKNKHDFSTKYCSLCKKERELELARQRVRRHRTSSM